MTKLDKMAGKGPPDPKQKHLREHKGNFNKEVSLMIAQLIAFKRGMNGRGEPRVGIPPSDIKFPLPDEVGQYLDEMAGRFEHIVADAKQVINEQAEYSGTRRKSKKELRDLGVEEEPMPIAASDEPSDLTKIASWWGSRLWSYIKYSPRLWNEQLQLRMKMLWVSTDVSKGLLDLENELVSTDDNAIPKAFYFLIKMQNRIVDDMTGTFNEIVELSKTAVADLSDEPKPEGEVVQERLSQREQSRESEPEMESEENLPAPLEGILNEEQVEESSWDPNIDFERLKLLVDDLSNIGPIIQKLSMVSLIDNEDANVISMKIKTINKMYFSLMGMKESYLESPELSESTANNAQRFEDAYNMVLKEISDRLGVSTGKEYDSFGSMKDDALALINNIASSNPAIEKLAHNWLTRVIKRWKLKIMPSYTDKLRLKCIEIIRNLHEEMGNLQDLLEDKNKDVIKVGNKLITVLKTFSNLSNKLIELSENHNSEYSEQRLSGDKVKIKQIDQKSMNVMRKAMVRFSNSADTIAVDLESLEEKMVGNTEKEEDAKGQNG